MKLASLPTMVLSSSTAFNLSLTPIYKFPEESMIGEKHHMVLLYFLPKNHLPICLWPTVRNKAKAGTMALLLRFGQKSDSAISCVLFCFLFIYLFIYLFIFIFAYNVWIISPLLPPSLSPPSSPPPPHYPARTILPLSLILLKREYKQ
jgi:hypothetical protein